MPTAERPLVSIISVTWNRRAEVLDLLAALRQQQYEPLEIIIVDNASRDGTAMAIEAGFPEVKLIRNHENLFMEGYNIGMREAAGEYLLLIDDDGLPSAADWISQMVTRFESNPSLGAIACEIRLTANGQLAPDNPAHLVTDDLLRGYPCATFVCTGAGVRASALRAVGLFPDFFFFTYMENVLSMRLWDAGWQVRYFPDIKVLHKKTPVDYEKVNWAHSYWAFRNYYWYVWMLYPWPAVVEETAHHTLHTLKLVAQGECSFRDWLRAVRDATAGYRTAKSHRHPVTEDVLALSYQVRRHRRPSFFLEVRKADAYRSIAEL